MNDIFKSNLVASSPWTDLRFMPKTPTMAMLYPAYWAFWRSHDTIELNMRDPRIFLGCLSALAIVAIHTTGWLKRPKLPLHSGEYISLYLAIALSCLVYRLGKSFWSIYRYLAIQEALGSGTLVLAALILLFGKRLKSVSMGGIFVATGAAALATSEYPWWSRAQRGSQAVSVSLPPIEPDAMVLFLDSYAYSYLVPFMPETARAVGVNSNLVRPGSPGKLQDEIARAIRDPKGTPVGDGIPRGVPWHSRCLPGHIRVEA